MRSPSFWRRTREVALQAPPERNRYVDSLRALSIGAVVVGHWLVCFALAVVAFDGIVPADGGTIRFGTVLAAVIGALLLEALPHRTD